MSRLIDRAGQAARHPRKIPGYLKRQVDHRFNTVQATRIVWPEPGRALLVDFGLRRPAGREVLVLTSTSVVSPGTERAFFNGLPNARPAYPYNPGYCGSGVVVEVGPGVTAFRPGDRVAGPLPHASAMVLDEIALVPVADEVTLDEAAFTRLAVIALQGVRKGRIALGERVAIVGQGVIGLLATQFAAQAGAYPLIAIAATDARLPLATRFGATEAISLSEGAPRVADARASLTIEATGNPEALATAISATREGGRIILLGSARGESRGLDLAELARRRITIQGAHVDGLSADRSPGRWDAASEARTYFRLIASKRVQVAPLITDELHPAEAEQFYRRLARSDRSMLAGMFRWESLPAKQRLDGLLWDTLTPVSSPKNARYWTGQSAGRNGHAVAPAEAPVVMSANEAVALRPAATLESTKPLRVGLIGCGEIAMQNARAISQSGRAEIAMVADVNPTIAADMGKRYGVPHTTNIDELLDRADVEAVFISVPHFLHAPLAIQACRHGKHVIVEKPMALSVAEADRMLDAARASGVKLSVCYCQRFQPAIQRAKELIDRGALGKILGVQVNFFIDKPWSYFTSGFSGRVHTDWRLSREKSGGGILVFNLVHYLDVIRFLTGLQVVRASAEFAALDTPIEMEDSLSATLRYANGAIGTITASSVVRGASYEPQIRLWGTEGQLNLQEPDRQAFYSLREIDGLRPGLWHPLGARPGVGERQAYVESFARSVREGDPLAVSGEDGRAIQVVVEAVYAAGERSTSVEVG